MTPANHEAKTFDPATLPPIFVQRGGDPEYVRQELLYAITAHADRHPRSQQVEVGPSEIGDPCSRRIGYKLAGVEETNARSNWFPTIGTAVHSWLQEAMQAENADCKNTRYVTEAKVRVGEVAGQPITGSCDLYDRTTAGVVDFKIVGTKSLRKYKAGGPGQQYRVQAHSYARGWQLLDQPVDWVGIYFLPRADQLDQGFFWHEPYDEQITLDALERVSGIAGAVNALGVNAPAALQTADAYCTWCPFYRANSTDVTTGCPGDPAATTDFPSSLAGIT